MQWIVQAFEDTSKLADVLDRMGLHYSLHKVVPFVGELSPEPEIEDAGKVVLFGAYTLWRYAEKHGLKPGVFTLRPFVHETPWQPYMLNGAQARFLTVSEVPDALAGDEHSYFLRPVDDSKEVPGRVLNAPDIVEMSSKVLALPEDEIPLGALRPETELMLTEPVSIQKEWRLWIVEDEIVTYSLYKEGRRVVYRSEIDADAIDFARKLVALNPRYQQAYVIDICRTSSGLRMLETNCLNAAGFYAADLGKLVAAIEGLGPRPA